MPVESHGLAEPPGGGAPVFHAAGGTAPGDVVCSECGYGVSMRGRLPACPMCGGRVWEDARMSGFAPPETLSPH
jgi:DNA-directed RNA polymerase subunit RPC12/RpoP